MESRYLDFISNEHLIECVKNLHGAYLKANRSFNKSEFYKNKIDSFKLLFDKSFNSLSEETLIKAEITRQADKSVNNSIGTFHEEILGGIIGYEKGNRSSYDIKSSDNLLFADIKNKHNTMNSSSSESLYQKLKSLADNNKGALCYWVQILAKSSFDEKWVGEINSKEYRHSRVYKISGDQFYYKLTGRENALYELYDCLPAVIDNNNLRINSTDNSAYDEISDKSASSKRGILEQIAYDNFNYYPGFDNL